MNFLPDTAPLPAQITKKPAVSGQQAYNLNSKMMSVMNEIYDKLINQTGL